MRLNQDGSLDLSYQPKFEVEGSDSPGLHSSVWDLRLGADDSAVVLGDFSRVNGINRMAIVRLRSDGSVDQSFAPPTDLQAPWNLRLVILLKDGRLLVQKSSDGSVRMLSASGKDDPSFNVPVFMSGFNLNPVIEDSNGRLLVGGQFSDDPTTHRVVALKRDGSLDPSFNPRLDLPGPPISVSIRSLLLQPDGKVLVAGRFESLDASGNVAANGFLVRLNTDGSSDPVFRFAPEVTADESAMLGAVEATSQDRQQKGKGVEKVSVPGTDTFLAE